MPAPLITISTAMSAAVSSRHPVLVVMPAVAGASPPATPSSESSVIIVLPDGSLSILDEPLLCAADILRDHPRCDLLADPLTPSDAVLAILPPNRNLRPGGTYYLTKRAGLSSSPSPSLSPRSCSPLPPHPFHGGAPSPAASLSATPPRSGSISPVSPYNACPRSSGSIRSIDSFDFNFGSSSGRGGSTLGGSINGSFDRLTDLGDEPQQQQRESQPAMVADRIPMSRTKPYDALSSQMPPRRGSEARGLPSTKTSLPPQHFAVTGLCKAAPRSNPILEELSALSDEDDAREPPNPQQPHPPRSLTTSTPASSPAASLPATDASASPAASPPSLKVRFLSRLARLRLRNLRLLPNRPSDGIFEDAIGGEMLEFSGLDSDDFLRSALSPSTFGLDRPDTYQQRSGTYYRHSDKYQRSHTYQQRSHTYQQRSSDAYQHCHSDTSQQRSHTYQRSNNGSRMSSTKEEEEEGGAWTNADNRLVMMTDTCGLRRHRRENDFAFAPHDLLSVLPLPYSGPVSEAAGEFGMREHTMGHAHANIRQKHQH